MGVFELTLIKEINSKAAIDKNLADNILPYMALLKDSKIKTSFITNHTKTNMYVIEKFLKNKFNIEKTMISY